MAENKFTPWTTEQKREYGKQFTPEERKSYYQGQRNAYSHMSNIGRRNSIFIGNNLKDNAPAPTPVKRSTNTKTRRK